MLRKPETVLGLDIGEKSIKLVELKRTAAGIILQNFAIKDVPPSKPGESKTLALTRTIREIIKEKDIKTTKAFSSVSGPEVNIRRITLPLLPPSELPEAVLWEVKNYIPFPIQEVILDFLVLGKVVDKGVEKLDIIAVAVQKNVLDRYISIIQQAGLKPAGISVILFALWDLIKETLHPPGEAVTALLDIGARAASINIYKGDNLQFTREITVAGESITSAMTGVLISDRWQLNLTREQAERIKKEYGIPQEGTAELTSEGIPLSQIAEIMRPPLRRLLNQLSRSFDYYKEQFHEASIDRILLAGGSSKLKNLESFLQQGLGIPVEIVNPLQGLHFDSQRINLEELRNIAPRLTLALGLALGQARRMNLLKVRKRTEKGIGLAKLTTTFRILKPGLISAGILILILALAIHLVLGRMSQHYKQELETKRLVLSDLKGLGERRAIISKITQEETNIRDTLGRLNAILPQGINLTSLSYDHSSRAMKVEGESPSPQLVGKFLESIEKSPHFHQAIFISMKIKDDGEGMNFKISSKID